MVFRKRLLNDWCDLDGWVSRPPVVRAVCYGSEPGALIQNGHQEHHKTEAKLRKALWGDGGWGAKE